MYFLNIISENTQNCVFCSLIYHKFRKLWDFAVVPRGLIEGTIQFQTILSWQ